MQVYMSEIVNFLIYVELVWLVAELHTISVYVFTKRNPGGSR